MAKAQKKALLRVKLNIGSLNPGNVASFPDEIRYDVKRPGVEFPSIASAHVDNKAAVRLSCAEALGANQDGKDEAGNRYGIVHLTPSAALEHGWTEEEVKAAMSKLPKDILARQKELMAGETKRKAAPLLGMGEMPSLEQSSQIIAGMSPLELRDTKGLIAEQKATLEGLEKRVNAAMAG